MKRRAGVLSLVAVLAVVAAQPVEAQANRGNASAPERTIWDGIYTEAQATRGQRTAQQNCGTCHSPKEWSNSVIISSWSGRTVSELTNHLRNTMPMDSPGRLTREQYTDIVAYILHLNKVPAGARELPSDENVLESIGVTRRESR